VQSQSTQTEVQIKEPNWWDTVIGDGITAASQMGPVCPVRETHEAIESGINSTQIEHGDYQPENVYVKVPFDCFSSDLNKNLYQTPETTVLPFPDFSLSFT